MMLVYCRIALERVRASARVCVRARLGACASGCVRVCTNAQAGVLAQTRACSRDHGGSRGGVERPSPAGPDRCLWAGVRVPVSACLCVCGCTGGGGAVAGSVVRGRRAAARLYRFKCVGVCVYVCVYMYIYYVCMYMNVYYSAQLLAASFEDDERRLAVDAQPQARGMKGQQGRFVLRVGGCWWVLVGVFVCVCACVRVCGFFCDSPPPPLAWGRRPAAGSFLFGEGLYKINCMYVCVYIYI
jgi:hypothetical protein